MLALHKICILSAAALCAASVGAQDSAKPNTPAELTVHFADVAWDGKTIPQGQQCRRQGGQGDTPPLLIKGVPEGANAIIVEYNDLSFRRLSANGGHGKIGYWIEPNDTVTIPAIQGETKGKKLEDKAAFVQSNARAISRGYLPPCSGGRGNTYAAIVRAVHKPKEEKRGKIQVLGVGRITLGKY